MKDIFTILRIPGQYFFSLKFLQFISHLHDRAKVPPSSCLIWSHLWFRLKLVPTPPLLYSYHKESCGKMSNPALETQGWNAPANWMFFWLLLNCFFAFPMQLLTPMWIFYALCLRLFCENCFYLGSTGQLNTNAQFDGHAFGSLLHNIFLRRCVTVAHQVTKTIFPYLAFCSTSVGLCGRHQLPFILILHAFHSFLEVFSCSYRLCLENLKIYVWVCFSLHSRES